MDNKLNEVNIIQTIMKIVAKKKEISVEIVKPDSTLVSLDIDSLETFDILFEIEHHYGIIFPKNFDEINTLLDVANLTLNVIENK